MPRSAAPWADQLRDAQVGEGGGCRRAVLRSEQGRRLWLPPRRVALGGAAFDQSVGASSASRGSHQHGSGFALGRSGCSCRRARVGGCRLRVGLRILRPSGQRLSGAAVSRRRLIGSPCRVPDGRPDRWARQPASLKGSSTRACPRAGSTCWMDQPQRGRPSSWWTRTSTPAPILWRPARAWPSASIRGAP